MHEKSEYSRNNKWKQSGGEKGQVRNHSMWPLSFAHSVKQRSHSLPSSYEVSSHSHRWRGGRSLIRELIAAVRPVVATVKCTGRLLLLSRYLGVKRYLRMVLPLHVPPPARIVLPGALLDNIAERKLYLSNSQSL